jgi:uncharacterized RDD family membrane protein YckC
MTTLAMANPEAMTSITAVTPTLAGRGARLGAALLDLLVFWVVLIPGFWIMSSSDSDMGKGFGGAFLVVGWLGLLVTQMVFLVKRGQSLGKMAVGIKIVRVADDSVPGFVKVVLLRMFVPSILAAIPYAGALIWLADVLFIFRDDRRCLHDLIAETKVVDAQAKTPETTMPGQHPTTDLRSGTHTEQLVVAQPPSMNEASTFPGTTGTVDSSLGNPLDTTVDEDRIYVAIANELETGATDKGLWTRLFAKCGGDENQAKVLYIKQRADRLIATEQARLDRAAHERAAEFMRLEELRLQSLEQENKLVPDLVTPPPATTNIASAPQLQSESQQNDERAGWILMAVVVGLALLTAALMQMK